MKTIPQIEEFIAGSGLDHEFADFYRRIGNYIFLFAEEYRRDAAVAMLRYAAKAALVERHDTASVKLDVIIAMFLGWILDAEKYLGLGDVADDLDGLHERARILLAWFGTGEDEGAFPGIFGSVERSKTDMSKNDSKPMPSVSVLVWSTLPSAAPGQLQESAGRRLISIWGPEKIHATVIVRHRPGRIGHTSLLILGGLRILVAEPDAIDIAQGLAAVVHDPEIGSGLNYPGLEVTFIEVGAETTDIGVAWPNKEDAQDLVGDF